MARSTAVCPQLYPDTQASGAHSVAHDKNLWATYLYLLRAQVLRWDSNSRLQTWGQNHRSDGVRLTTRTQERSAGAQRDGEGSRGRPTRGPLPGSAPRRHLSPGRPSFGGRPRGQRRADRGPGCAYLRVPRLLGGPRRARGTSGARTPQGRTWALGPRAACTPAPGGHRAWPGDAGPSSVGQLRTPPATPRRGPGPR